MDLLIDNTPAENLMLRDKGTTSLNLLLKATLLHLILKKVLQFQEIHRRPHPADDVKRYIYVVKGPAFNDYEPRRHEDMFLRNYEYGEHRFLFRNLIRLAFEDARDERSFRTRIMNMPSSIGWWRTGLGSILGRPLLTNAGEAARRSLLEQIKELERTLFPLLEQGDPKAIGSLERFGGNILLIPEFPIAVLPQFTGSAYVPGQYQGDTPMVHQGLAFAAIATLSVGEFDHGFDSAEAAAGADGSGSGGGCSGCGGCSGGGCGGCGGCGG